MSIKLPKIEELHHAYLVIGGSREVGFLEEYFIENNIAIAGNPDFVSESFQVFTIDQARLLKARQAQKSQTERKFFIITCSRITKEAQNALLKVLEEPTSGTHFFFVMPNKSTLIPTLVSRIQVIELTQKQVDQEKINTRDFLKLSIEGRLEKIKKITDSKAGDKAITKPEAIHFLNELEEILHEQISPKQNYDVFEEIRQTRSYLHDQGSSLKMLLEHISLLI